NELVRSFHERMPVIFPDEYHADWLDPRAPAPQWLQTVLRPFPADAMQATAVNPFMNNARHEGQSVFNRWREPRPHFTLPTAAPPWPAERGFPRRLPVPFARQPSTPCA